MIGLSFLAHLQCADSITRQTRGGATESLTPGYLLPHLRRSGFQFPRSGLTLNCLALATCILSLSFLASAQDITKLEKIGPVVSFTKSEKAVVFNCQDNSQVSVTLLASDLVRIRASFARPLPAKDHSWAIAKTEWPTPRWSLSETKDSVLITTDEIEVVVHRSPLLIEFRDAKTHDIINADEQPMAYDAKGLLKETMFDPQAGTFVAAAKKFGFDEHFYGLREGSAAR